MKTRLLTAAGMAVVGIPLIIFSKYVMFPIALGLLALIGTFEMFRVLKIEKNYFLSVPAYLMAFAGPILAYYFATAHTITFIISVAAALFAYLVYMFFVAVFMKGKLKFADVSMAFTSATYIIMSFTSMAVMRYIQGGVWNFVTILVVAWGSDVFAYFTGRLLGRHKLIPEVSPKKTVEGSIGGIVFSVGLTILYGFIVSRVTELAPNYIALAICGVVLSVASQLGDLIASLIKREHGIKDYGRIFPGHGGVMDRFDSILSIATILMAVCILFPLFS